MNTFGKHLGKKIHKERRGGTVYYYDVRLNPAAEEAYPDKKAEKEKGYGNDFWGKGSRS